MMSNLCNFLEARINVEQNCMEMEDVIDIDGF